MGQRGRRTGPKGSQTAAGSKAGRNDGGGNPPGSRSASNRSKASGRTKSRNTGSRTSGRRSKGRSKGHSKSSSKSTSDSGLTLSAPAKKVMHDENFHHEEKRYGVLFFDSPAEARQNWSKVTVALESVDQLNIVLRSEPQPGAGTTDLYPDDLPIEAEQAQERESIKIFSGAAWTLIHERRREDGWYDAPR